MNRKIVSFLLFHMNYGVLCRRTFFDPKKESRSRKLNEDEQVIGLLKFCNLFTFKNTILASAISMNSSMCVGLWTHHSMERGL